MSSSVRSCPAPRQITLNIQYYRYGVRALNRAIELCQEAEKELAG